MINLAGLRYRGVFAETGGPIARIEVAEVRIGGDRCFQANAYLRSGLLPASPERRLYSDAAGTGTHASPLVARHMAISEALERWCYATVALGPRRRHFGFEADPMSNGMAAFPGLFARQARAAALREAIERRHVTAWWEGLVSGAERATAWPGVQAVVIGTGDGPITVILHERGPDGLTAYGHAAPADFDQACRRAAVEMARHQHVVRSYRRARGCGAIAAPPTCLLERRSLYFASPEGRADFDARRRLSADGRLPPARIVFDGEIPGPWSRYATVWRVAFEPVSARSREDDERYFLW